MLEAAALSDTGLARTNNEDYCHLEPGLGFYVLADGMGGARAGERASQLAVDTVTEVLRAAPERTPETLRGAFEEANRRVRDAARSDPSLEGMGTTLVVALETGPDLAIASVGDSRAYLFDGEQLRTITQDQTWVSEVGRPLGIPEEALRRHPMRHILTMAIGAATEVTVNSYQVGIEPGSVVLLSSDGLHDVVEPGELERILRAANGAPLHESCGRLIEAARNAGGPDNITAVLLRKRDGVQNR